MTASSLTHDRPYSVLPQQTHTLPFKVRLAKVPADLARVLALRAQAYGRHVPELADSLGRAEPDDLRADTLLLLAESKEDGSLLGSMRLINNLHQPLKIEQETTLPAKFWGRRLVEARRLTVLPGTQGRMVSTALSKAMYEICFFSAMDEVLITARHPVDKMYRTMQFEDALGGQKLCLSDVSNLPHGLYCLPVRDADARWRKAECPLYPFMAQTRHPDIEIDYDVVHRRFSCLLAVSEGEHRLSTALA